MSNYEIPKTTEKRTLCCFVLDVSGSMSTNNNIDEMNAALNDFVKEISGDIDFVNNIEIAVVTFDDQVNVIQDAALSEDVPPLQLLTGGTTAMVDGVRKGIEVITVRKDYYKRSGLPYTRSFLVLITDGAPDSGQDVAGLARQIEQDTKSGRYVFMSLGVSGADMNVLEQISGYLGDGHGGYDRIKPLPLKGAAFKGFFSFIAQSSKAASAKAGSKTNDGIDSSVVPDWLLGT